MSNPAGQSPPSKKVISVIIICLNDTPTQIDRTMQSIISQDYLHKELIVIDGGSKTETIMALKKYSSHITYYTSEKDNGIFDAQNKGITHSNSDWITIMNIGDRYTSSDILTKMLHARKDKDVMLVYGDAALYADEKLQWVEPVPQVLSKRFLYHGMICHQAMLIARSAYMKVGLLNASYRILADKEWLLRFMRTGLGSLHCGHTICDWSVGGISGNQKLITQEKKKILHEYYLPYEIAVFAIYWILRRIIHRIISLSLAIPSKLRNTCNCLRDTL